MNDVELRSFSGVDLVPWGVVLMSTSLTGRLSAVVLALAGVVSDLRKDGAYAVRTFMKSPAFAAVGVLSLALSIGASALYFAQVDALVGRTLPGAPDPDRLVVTQAPVSFPDFEHFREQRSIAARAAGLLLACIGLAGVTTQAVARRRKEIGIRLALGSSRGRVIRLVLREAVVLVTVGAVLGFAGGFALSRVLSATNAELARLFAAGAGDPVLLVGAPLLLGGLALAACHLPAHRAGRIDPLSSLREE